MEIGISEDGTYGCHGDLDVEPDQAYNWFLYMAAYPDLAPEVKEHILKCAEMARETYLAKRNPS